MNAKRESEPNAASEGALSPRERIARYGPQALSTVELLAILLKGGADERTPVELAETLLKRKNGLRGVARATVKELSGVKGMGPVRGLQLAVCIELGRRIGARTSEPNPQIQSPEDVADLLAPHVYGAKVERFFTLLLDKKSRVIRVHEVSVGTLDSSLVHPREVFKEAIAASAASLIAAHNHPSGDPSPSHEDRDVTIRLADSGKLIGIPLVDHVIIGADDRWTSMNQLGLL